MDSKALEEFMDKVKSEGYAEGYNIGYKKGLADGKSGSEAIKKVVGMKLLEVVRILTGKESVDVVVEEAVKEVETVEAKVGGKRGRPKKVKQVEKQVIVDEGEVGIPYVDPAAKAVVFSTAGAKVGMGRGAEKLVSIPMGMNEHTKY